MADTKTENQYYEVEVTQPDATEAGRCYLRLGTWVDNTNAGATKMRALTEAKQLAVSAPTTANLASLKSTAGLTGEAATAFDAADDDFVTKQAARATAHGNLGTAQTNYDNAAADAQTKHAAVTAAKAALNAASSRPIAEQSRLVTAYKSAEHKYQQAQTIHERRRSELRAKKEAYLEKQGAYAAAKAQLMSHIDDAIEAARSQAITEAENNATQKKRGHDLAMRITDFYDDTRSRGPFENLTEAQRKAESAKLHTKGGWRDHTDGNRISTTRGDKVEVIRGNYRRMVLGRQGDADEACLLDASGGLYRDGDFAPGSVVLVEYSTKYGDTWKVVEETSKGDVINKYHGDVEEHFYGNHVKSYVGKPGGADWEDAEAIKPDVEEVTWAKKITSETHASKISETTRLTDSMHSNTTVGAGVVDMLAVGAGIVEMTTVGASHIEMELATTHIEMEASGAHLALELNILNLDFYAGIKMEIAAGRNYEIDFAERFEFNFDKKEFDAVDEKFTGLKRDIDGVRDTIAGKERSLIGKIDEVNGKVTKVAADVMELQPKKTEVSGQTDFL